MNVVEGIRDLAHDFELNALAQKDRGDEQSAREFTVAALITYGIAKVFAEADEDSEETQAA